MIPFITNDTNFEGFFIMTGGDIGTAAIAAKRVNKVKVTNILSIKSCSIEWPEKRQKNTDTHF